MNLEKALKETAALLCSGLTLRTRRWNEEDMKNKVQDLRSFKLSGIALFNLFIQVRWQRFLLRP